MLDIPESVKTLFTRDDIRKNFRASFIREGLPDITNENIVTESVQFTESVCSRNSFCFGLAESSVIEFETVGVKNILGEYFDAWIEIDATTLPAEIQTVRPDLNYPVYPVQIGRFVVTACPRNHEAMAHRRITAMTELSYDKILSHNADAILTAKYTSTKKVTLNCAISMDTIALIWKDADPADITEVNRIAPPVTYREGTGNTWSQIRLAKLRYTKKNEDVVNVWRYRTVATIMTSPPNAATSCRFALQDMRPETDEAMARKIADALYNKYSPLYYVENSYTPTYEEASYDTVLEQVREAIDINGTLIDWTFSLFDQLTGYRDKERRVPNPYDWINIPAVTPTSSNVLVASNGQGCWAYSVAKRHDEAPTALDDIFRTYEATGAEPLLITQSYTSPDTLYQLQSQVVSGPDNNQRYGIMFPNLTPLYDAIRAYMELSGAFSTFRQPSGRPELKHMAAEPAMRVDPTKYVQAWWDEYDVAPIGAIRYKLNSQDMEYVFNENAPSYYVFQSSELFDHMQNVTQEQAQALFSSELVPALQNLSFTPAEIEAQGLPYLEAGDCIEIEAHDGTIVKTYVLQRNLTGIQCLTDQITADGITIVEVNV